jgi:hypothetical protein
VTILPLDKLMAKISLNAKIDYDAKTGYKNPL